MESLRSLEAVRSFEKLAEAEKRLRQRDADVWVLGDSIPL
jgi:hypothetical protein